jgi:uncharacterized membrane protein
MSEAAQDRTEARAGREAEREMERLLLSSAQAIQRLIAERDALRAQVGLQQQELKRLQRHVALFHDTYRRLTSEFVSQFQLIDDALSGVVGEKPQENEASQPEPEAGSRC